MSRTRIRDVTARANQELEHAHRVLAKVESILDQFKQSGIEITPAWQGKALPVSIIIKPRNEDAKS